MSRLQKMKSEGLDKVYVMYSRSTFFGKGKTMQEVLDGIIESAQVSGREHTSKTKVKTLKATMKV
jgi:hypothetical protein